MGTARLGTDNASVLVESCRRLVVVLVVEAVAAKVDGRGRGRLERLLHGLVGARDVEGRRGFEGGRDVVAEGAVGEEGEALARVDGAGLGEERHCFFWLVG